MSINNNTTQTDVLLSRNFDRNRFTIDELVGLAATGTTMRAVYTVHGVEEPDQFTTNLKLILRGIRDLNEDVRARKIAQLKSELEGTQSRTERRTKLQEELTKLENPNSTATGS